MENLGGLLFCLIPILGLFFFVVWLIALIDAVKSDFKTENEKIVWVIVIILTGIVGAVLYFFISDAKRKPDKY